MSEPEPVIEAIDTDIIDLIILKVLSESTATNVKLEHIISFGRLVQERTRVGALPAALRAAILAALA